jgi:phosphatidylglycerophosphate synthase
MSYGGAVTTVRSGPAAGLIAQVALVAVLASTLGLGPVGWLVGLTYALVMASLLERGLVRSQRLAFGPADWVTLGRTVLVGGVTALVADALAGLPASAAIVALTIVALLLDGVDGQVARRTGTVSAFGARFDMEVDSFLVLVLSAYAAAGAGPWVLTLGLARYAFVAAGWVLPWMRAQLPPRYWRKVVAAVQGIALVAAAAGVLPAALELSGLVVAFVLLVESFGRDVLWLGLRGARLRRPSPEVVGAPHG